MERIFKIFIIVVILGVYLLGEEANVFASNEVQHEVARIYQNEEFHFQMMPPDGWRVVIAPAPDKKMIWLFKTIPLTYNGLPISSNITITPHKLNNPKYKSFNEVPKDKLEALMAECLRDLEKSGKAEGTIRNIGIHKVCWLIVSEEKILFDSTLKSIHIMFMENGYVWSMYAVNVPEAYYDTMNKEMEQLIESFTTI